MATPADQRLLELLEKWLSSLELHAKYSSLDDGTYSQIQPWPEHQRPSRWIIDLARQKALALRDQVQERVEMGDAKFSDSLELMTFLANLVGSEHIERFIPLAHAENERSGEETLDQRGDHTAAPDADAPPSETAATTRQASVGRDATATREMPKFVGKQRTPAPAGTANVARAERKTAKTPPKPNGSTKTTPGAKAGSKPAVAAPANPAPAPIAESGSPARHATYDKNGPSEAAREQVIADAARLVQWGRRWYELAELIASMADRPHLIDVRRILKDNKTIIDKKAGRG
jgi:hypothetical protein